MAGGRFASGRPGPIATPVIGKFQGALPKTAHPQFRRLAALFAACVKQQPTSPFAVAEQIRQIVEGESWQLRYPAGLAPLAIKWRAKTTDEDW